MEQTPVRVGQNFLASLTNGLRAGQMTQQINRQNALGQYLAEHGEGLSKGDPTALAGYAAFDPQGAFSMGQQVAAGNRAAESHTAQMQFSEARLAELRAEGARAAQTHAAQMSDYQRQETSRKLAGLLSEGSAAYQGGPEQLNAWVQSHAQEMVANNLDPADFTYETFPGQVARYEGLLEGLSAGVELGNALTQPPKQSGKEAQIARLQATGMTYDQAVKTVDGAYRQITDPVTKETVLIDLATGQPVFTMGQGASQHPVAQAPQRPNLSNGAMPAGNGTNGQASPAPASLPPLSNAEDAFGVEGMAKGTINSVADTFGLQVPFEGVQRTMSDFKVLRESLIRDISSGYNRPPSWLLQNIRDLTPAVGGPQGAQSAQSQLRALRDSMTDEMATTQRQMARRMSPKGRETLEQQAAGLNNAIAKIDAALGGFGDGAQSTTSSGVKWRIEQ